MFDILAIDWGEKRCGFAFGDSHSGLIMPHSEIISTKQALHFVQIQVKAKKIRTMIVGLPTNVQLKPTQTTDRIRDFISQLRALFSDLQVIEVNERGSTQAVRSKFGRVNAATKIKIDKVDNLAAAEILEIYFLR